MALIREYAANLTNRLSKENDGMVGYERVKGKKPTILGVEFGEKLLWKPRVSGNLQKMNPRWEYGIFVGIRKKSNEVLVAKKEGYFQSDPSRDCR